MPDAEGFADVDRAVRVRGEDVEDIGARVGQPRLAKGSERLARAFCIAASTCCSTEADEVASKARAKSSTTHTSSPSEAMATPRTL